MRIVLIIIIAFILFKPLYLNAAVYDKDTNILFEEEAWPGGILPDENMQINNKAVVNIDFLPTKNFPDNWFFAAFLRGNGSNITFQGDGDLNFFLDGTKFSGYQWGAFLYKDWNTGQSNIAFNVNTTFLAKDNSSIGRGAFVENGAAGGYARGSFSFTKNLFVDVNNTIPVNSSRTILFIERYGNGYINSDPANKIINIHNIIQLKGDIKVGVGSRFAMNLTNPESFFMGKISNNASANLTLLNGAKWYMTNSSQISVLDISNSFVPDTSSNAKGSQIFSFVDLAKYATPNTSGIYCPNDNCPRIHDPFSPRTLKVSTINGENGVFRLMSDLSLGKTDTITAGNVNGL
ncbi:hypothetical protein, partial [Helicobacter sp. 12S02232-10]|uniref:hypothetical protein n=1 Tax=Helicobacter sp. 12S02232-10 TaxID=1476197 RepID=UPI00117AF355